MLRVFQLLQVVLFLQYQFFVFDISPKAFHSPINIRTFIRCYDVLNSCPVSLSDSSLNFIFPFIVFLLYVSAIILFVASI